MSRRPTARRLPVFCLSAILAAAALSGPVSVAEPAPEAVDASPQPRWWKGNLHAHTLWSDGDHYPEMAVDWYVQHGYHFLSISDHDVMAEGQRWIDIAKSRGGTAAYEKYRARFGEDWVETRAEAQRGTEVRLKPLSEYRALFEQAGKFLLIPAEEISAKCGKAPVHVGAVNLREVIKPLGGSSVLEVMQKNIDAVLEQRERTGIPMFPHINHPNFRYAIQADDLAQVRGELFFEVYNGHPGVNNLGDASHIGTERMWDIVLTLRLAKLGLPVLYGIATDDTHAYHQFATGKANPGQGWVVVRARHLTPESIVHAMEAGDFYASTGVMLDEVRCDGKTIQVRVVQRPGENCRVTFIGTRIPPGGAAHLEDVTGMTLASFAGPVATYTMKGDELYVRARIDSSVTKKVPTVAEQATEQAWTQPFVPRR